MSTKRTRYLSIPLLELSASREFPGPLYLCLTHKIIRYRNTGDMIDATEYNKLVYNNVKCLFIEEDDKEAFDSWCNANDCSSLEETAKVETVETKEIIQATQEQRRAMMDIFTDVKGEPQIVAAVEASKKMVNEFLRKPFAINNIQSIQKYSKGCLDHSVNVSVLSVFLGLRLGYSHQTILGNLALGGLFHDIGLMLIDRKDSANDIDHMITENDPVFQEHPQIGRDFLEQGKDKIPEEVKLIVSQHHEYVDGTGFPSKLKGLAIYDLARLVAIANIYDSFVSESKASTMKERATEALDRMETEYSKVLDQKKLEKAIKVLRFSLLA